MGDYNGGWQGGGGGSGRGGSYRVGSGNYSGRNQPGRGRGQGGQGDFYNAPYQSSRGGYQDQGGSRGGGGGRGGGDYNQGGSRGGFYDNDFNSGWRGGRSGRGRSQNRYQGNWGGGRGRERTPDQGADSSRRKRDEEIALPLDVQFYKEVGAHEKKIACMVIDPAAKMIYTGSADGHVKCWNAENGNCVTVVDVGGAVTSMLLSGGFLFVGIKKAEEGIIKVYNLASGQNHQLPGHKGEILCLLAAGGMLFSGGQDRSIRAWNFNAQAGIFMSQAIITRDEGGHEAPVHCFQSFGTFMFSADRYGCIKVWDLTTGAVAQTLQNAHEEAVTHMLLWESFLLTTSMDGTVKIWEILSQPMPSMIIKPEAVFAFDKDKDKREEAPQQHNPNQYRRPPKTAAIWSLAGTLDAAGTPILMVSYHNEGCVRLFEVPTFNSRGVLTPAPDTRCLSMMLSPEGKGHMMLVGDDLGKLRIFGWNQMPAEAGMQ